LCRQIRRNHIRLGLRLVDPGALAESADDSPAVVAARLHHRTGALLICVARWRNPEFDGLSLHRKRQSGGHHPDHCVRVSAQGDRSPDDSRVPSEILLPALPAEDDGIALGTAAGLLFFWKEVSAQRRRHAKQWK
jgi:hypothetical protein